MNRLNLEQFGVIELSKKEMMEVFGGQEPSEMAMESVWLFNRAVVTIALFTSTAGLGAIVLGAGILTYSVIKHYNKSTTKPALQ